MQHWVRNAAIIAAAAWMANPALAAAPTCTPTAQIAPQHYPGAKNIPTTNNLLLPTGKAVEAEGQKLIIQGRVLDARCMPVQDAVVELWQANPYGNWVLADDDALATPNATFAGAGRAITGVDGTFQFVTAFPGPVGKRAPNLNIRVAAEDMGSLSTILYFENDNRNAKDVVYKGLKPASRNTVLITMGQADNGDLVGMLDIVMRAKAPYQTY